MFHETGNELLSQGKTTTLNILQPYFIQHHRGGQKDHARKLNCQGSRMRLQNIDPETNIVFVTPVTG